MNTDTHDITTPWYQSYTIWRFKDLNRTQLEQRAKALVVLVVYFAIFSTLLLTGFSGWQAFHITMAVNCALCAKMIPQKLCETYGNRYEGIAVVTFLFSAFLFFSQLHAAFPGLR